MPHDRDLAERSRLALSVLDSLLEGCQVIRFDWKYLYVNDVVAAQGRRPKEELVGRTMTDCYPGIEQTQCGRPSAWSRLAPRIRLASTTKVRRRTLCDSRVPCLGMVTSCPSSGWHSAKSECCLAV